MTEEQLIEALAVELAAYLPVETRNRRHRAAFDDFEPCAWEHSDVRLAARQDARRVLGALHRVRGQLG